MNVYPMDGQYWNFLVTIGVFRSVVEKRFSSALFPEFHVSMISIFGSFVPSFDWNTGRLCDSKEVKIWKDNKRRIANRVTKGVKDNIYSDTIFY